MFERKRYNSAMCARNRVRLARMSGSGSIEMAMGLIRLFWGRLPK